MGLLESGLSTVALARWMEQNGHRFENFWGREGQISMTRDRCYKSLAWVRSWVLATTTSHIAPFTAELFRSIETKCNVKLFASTNDKNVSVEAIATCWQLELVVSEIDLRMALSHCFIAYSSRKVVNHQFKIIKDTLEIELELIFFFFLFLTHHFRHCWEKGYSYFLPASIQSSHIMIKRMWIIICSLERTLCSLTFLSAWKRVFEQNIHQTDE